MKVIMHSFGTNQNFYLQSTFLIINLLQYRDEIDSINVITDKPHYYNRLSNYINIFAVDEHTLRVWAGDYNFVFRVKLKAIEMIIKHDKGDSPVLYLDVDTFIYQGFEVMKQELLSRKALMHNNEGKLSACPTHSAARVWNGVKYKTLGGYTISKDDVMWNAGVIGIPTGSCDEIIDTAIMMCDDMCRLIPVNFLIEQFCVSVALQRKFEIQAASGCVGHYWSNRDAWTGLIAGFITESFMKNYTVEEDVRRIAEFDFGQIPIACIKTNTEIKLHRAISGYFRPKVLSTIEYRKK